MVKNRHNSQLSLLDVSNNRPIIVKYRETSVKIFVKKSIGSDFRMSFFRCPIHTPRHFSGQVPTRPPGSGIVFLTQKQLRLNFPKLTILLEVCFFPFLAPFSSFPPHPGDRCNPFCLIKYEFLDFPRQVSLMRLVETLLSPFFL